MHFDGKFFTRRHSSLYLYPPNTRLKSVVQLFFQYTASEHSTCIITLNLLKLSVNSPRPNGLVGVVMSASLCDGAAYEWRWWAARRGVSSARSATLPDRPPASPASDSRDESSRMIWLD